MEGVVGRTTGEDDASCRDHRATEVRRSPLVAARNVSELGDASERPFPFEIATIEIDSRQRPPWRRVARRAVGRDQMTAAHGVRGPVLRPEFIETTSTRRDGLQVAPGDEIDECDDAV